MAHQGDVTTEPTLVRDLTLFSSTMIGVGAMIGAGIFVLTGVGAGWPGPALPDRGGRPETLRRARRPCTGRDHRRPGAHAPAFGRGRFRGRSG